MLISSDKNGVDRPLNDCSLKSDFTIKSDGTFIETSYYSEDDESCRLSFSDPGTWENLGNNTYRIKYDADGDTYEEDISVKNNTFSVFYDEPYIYNYKKKYSYITHYLKDQKTY